MPRFAILIHDHPFVHWDLLLEDGATAKTWRLLESPDRWLTAAVPATLAAEPIADHRLVYLEYEGEISRERGTVVRWDAGEFEWLDQSTNCYQFRLCGRRLAGHVTLQRHAETCQWAASYSESKTENRKPKIPKACPSSSSLAATDPRRQTESVPP